MQTLFSSWYGVVLDLRIKNGKAKALADWKLSYKYHILKVLVQRIEIAGMIGLP
jgi:hypothetical protein